MGRRFAKTTQLIKAVLSQGVFRLVSHPQAAVSYWRRIADAARDLREAPPSLRLPRSDLSELVPQPEATAVSLVDYRYSYGGMPLDELIALCRIVRHRNPATVFEIGTFRGETTLQLSANSRAEIYTLDLTPFGRPGFVPPRVENPGLDVHPEEPGVRFQGSEHEGRIHQLFGDSQTFDSSPYDGRVDLVLVDACHHYEAVLCDSRTALDMVSPEGIILWHDYAPYAPGVVRALDELSRYWPLRHLRPTSLVFLDKKTSPP